MQKGVKMTRFIKILKEAIKGLEGLNIAILYHFDVDGCASASILARIFTKINVRYEQIPITRGYEKSIEEKIRSSHFDRILLVDYVPDTSFLNIMSTYKAILIDHHKHEDFLNGFQYYTSEDYDCNLAISYTLYKLAKEFNIENLDWLAKLSSFWDKCIEFTEFNEQDVYSKNMELFLPFNLLVNLTALKGAKKLVEIFNESESFDDALNNLKQSQDYLKAKEIFKKEFNDIQKTKQVFPEIKLEIYKIRTKFKHIRVYVDYLSFTKDEGTMVYIVDEKNQFKFSFRTTFEIDLEEIVKQMSKEIKEFSGGGHKKACGAILRSHDVDSVINRFSELYKEKYLEKEKLEKSS